MNHKFQVLKSSWGIVILVDIVEIINPVISTNDVAINEHLYIRLNAIAYIPDETINFWFAKAIRDVEGELNGILPNSIVCFSINSINFGLTDFQEEGLYCVMLGWLEKKYGINVPKVEIDFDSQLNKYVFKTGGISLAGK